jgi:hypothetical protein
MSRLTITIPEAAPAASGPLLCPVTAARRSPAMRNHG